MPKTLKRLGILLFIALIVSGCSAVPSSKEQGQSSQETKLDWNKQAPDTKGKTITVLWQPGEWKAGVLKDFTKKTGIKVKQIQVNYGALYNKITTAAMSNSSDIDLVEMDTIWTGQFYKGGIVQELTSAMPENVRNQFTSSSINSLTNDGHVMAVPFFSSTKHFYWNNELLKKAGIDAPPTTWTEFKEDSLKLKAKGIVASGWSWQQAESLICDYVAFVKSFGGEFFDQNGKPTFNKGGGLQALQFMVDLYNTDKTVMPASLQWNENNVTDAFSAGKIAMMTNWEGQYPGLNDPSNSKVAGKTDMGLIPGEGSVKSASVTGTAGLAMMKNSKNKGAAFELVKFIASKGYQIPQFTQDGWYPSVEGLFNDPEIVKADKTGTIGKISEQYKYGVDRPSAPGYVNWSDILAGELHSALRKEKTPEEALNSAVEKIEKVMEENK